MEQVLAQYREWLDRQGYSPLTCTVYYRTVEQFFSRYGADHWDAATIQTFLAQRSEDPITQRKLLSALKNFGLWWGRPVTLRSPRAARRLPAVPTQRSIQELFHREDLPLRERVLFSVLYSSGIRVSEAAKLLWDDWDAERGTLRIRQGKGRKDRVALLSRDANRLLATWRQRQPQPRIFPWSPRWIEKLCARYGLHPHQFRHALGTHLMEHHADLRAVQEILGHANLQTTQLYLHVTQSHLESQYQLLHARP